MASRRPLVTIGGLRQELPIADTLAGVAGYGQYPRSGAYVGAGVGGVQTPGVGVLRVAPIWLTQPGTADRIGIEVSAGQSGATEVLVVYAFDSSGMPGDLIESQTVSATATGFAEATISRLFPAGAYFIGAMALGSTAPTVRIISSSTPPPLPVTVQGDMATPVLGYQRTGLSSAPSPMGATGPATSNVPRAYLRFS